MKPSFETLIELLDRGGDPVIVPWAGRELISEHSDRVLEFLPRLLELGAEKPWLADALLEDASAMAVDARIEGQREHLEAIASQAEGPAAFIALRWLGRWEGKSARGALLAILEGEGSKKPEASREPEGSEESNRLVRMGGAVAGLLEIDDPAATEAALRHVREHSDRDGKPVVDWALALVGPRAPDEALAEAARLFRRLQTEPEANEQAQLLAASAGTQRAWSAFREVAGKQRGNDFRRLVKANLPGVFEDEVLDEIAEDVDRGELGRSASVIVDALKAQAIPEPRSEAPKSGRLAGRLLRIFLHEDLHWNQAAGVVRRELVSLLLAWWTAAQQAAQEPVDPSNLSFDEIFWDLRSPKLVSPIDDEALKERARCFSAEERGKLGELLAADRTTLGIEEGRLWTVLGATRQPEALEQILGKIRGDDESIHAAWFSGLDAYGEEALPAVRELILDTSLAHPIRSLAFAVLTHLASEEQIESFIVESFETLAGWLTDGLLRWIEHHPSEKYLPLLADWYRPGESDIAWVGLLHCELLGAEPALEKRFLKALRRKQERDEERARQMQENPLAYFDEVSLRLRCTSCHRTYTYDVHMILLDLNALDQSELGVSSIARIQSRVKCKSCKAIDHYALTWSAEDHLRTLMSQAFGLLPRLQTPRLGALAFFVIQSEYLPAERPTVEQLIQKLREVSQERPHDARIVMELTRQLLVLHQFDEALEQLDRAAELEPDAAEPHFVRGTIHERFERYAEAHDAYLKAYEHLESGKDLGESAASIAMALGNHLPDTLASLGKPVSSQMLKHLEEIATRRSTILTPDEMPTELAAELAGGTQPSQVAPNAPCPCGSGRKFKACHGRK